MDFAIEGLTDDQVFELVICATRHPVPDAARITFYRSDFYCTHAKKLTQEAMRGTSEWSVAERELMTAYISKANESPFCVGAHTATSSQAFGDRAKVQAVLDDLDSAPVGEPLRATLALLDQAGYDAGAKYLLKQGYG